MNKNLFPATQNVAYLDSAAEGLPPITVREAMEEYWREKSRGSQGRARHYAVQAEAEQAVATLLSAPVEDVVLLSHASEAMNLLANSIDWRDGDEVLICDLEFPSGVVVWLRLQALGVRLIVVPTVDGATYLEDWTSRITTRTRVVFVSQVSYKSGTQIPFLNQLADAAHQAGALFCVDATQALGRVPVSIKGVDFLVASSYKWLLTTHGLGVVYAPPAIRERLNAATAGWYSAASLFHPDRFSSYSPKNTAGSLQTGMPNFPALYALKAGVQVLLEIGVEQINETLRPLVARLRQGLVDLGYTPLIPAGPEFASGIVSIACDDAETLVEHLAAHGVIVWGGDGRVRFAVHLYNDDADIDRCLAALRQ